MAMHNITSERISAVTYDIETIKESRERCRGYSETAIKEVKAEMASLRSEMTTSNATLDGKVTKIMELLIERR